MRLGLHAARLFGVMASCGWAFAMASCIPLPLCDESPDYCDLRFAEGPLKKCIPRENLTAPDDSCGVFVRASGKIGARGTKEDPVPTLRAAVEIWKSKSPSTSNSALSIYLCAETITEEDGNTEVISGGVPIYGSLDCSDGWAYTTQRTTLTAPAGQVPLRVSGAGIKFTDVDIVAADAPDTMPGVSSIAIIADTANVTFDGSTIVAGNGARGMPGEPHATPATGGVVGKSGIEACNIDAGDPTVGTTSMCGAESSKGGDGGPGAPAVAAGDGKAGTPGSMMNGGQGQESVVLVCTDGVVGDVGMMGDPGPVAMGLGKIYAADGYVGPAGQEGKLGTIGQGGGGGGGTMSNPDGMVQPCGSAFPGASGGSGGTGGCGGAGGRGGGAAGSSIGIVSINSTFTFTGSIVRVGNGGVGGEGGPGQTGGAGGMGGMGGASVNGVAAGCNGGAGGKGGDGGKGGNGLGGHAIGIAFTGLAPALENPPTFELMGEPGEGAVKKDVQDFPP